MKVPAAVVLAILTVGDQYALQHRDERAGIVSPGYWALFGGGLETGESPLSGVRREVREELALDIAAWRQLWTVRPFVPFWAAAVPHVIFAADVTDVWAQHVLREGQGTGVFSIGALPAPMEPLVSGLLRRYHRAARSTAI